MMLTKACAGRGGGNHDLGRGEAGAFGPACNVDGSEEVASEGPASERAEEGARADFEAEIERLRRASKLQSELVAAVAHDLRTPLAGVVGFTELLLKHDFEPETRERYLRVINRETRRLGRLIDDLFDVQLLVDGASNLVLEDFDLAELLAQQVDLFRIQSTAHLLRLELPEGPLVACADRDRIAQVVANLLSNALKYSPDGGTVVVRAVVEEDTLRVSVQDCGVGIPEDQHHLVFTRFFRAESPGTTRTKGVGLGLALSQEIVHAHGGSLGFDSARGEGSTFWFELGGHRAGDPPAVVDPTSSAEAGRAGR